MVQPTVQVLQSPILYIYYERKGRGPRLYLLLLDIASGFSVGDGLVPWKLCYSYSHSLERSNSCVLHSLAPLLHCPRSRGRQEAPPSAWEGVYWSRCRIPIVLGHVIHSKPPAAWRVKCSAFSTHAYARRRMKCGVHSDVLRDHHDPAEEIVVSLARKIQLLAPNWAWQQNSRLRGTAHEYCRLGRD